MAYSDFTFAKLKKHYNIVQDEAYLFESLAIVSISPSSRLSEDLQDAKKMPLYSEKAKSESIIYPIIRELINTNPQITLFSGISFNIESEIMLSGIPDFMISAKPRRADIEAPVFCMVEAKHGIIESGFAQCAAEMYAARLFNRENNEPYETIYGAVTNAYDWVFMKLEGNTIFIDKERYFLNELPKLLGILQFIVNQYKN
jgi:hypothetical protein